MSDENRSAIGAFCASRIQRLGKCVVSSYNFDYERDKLSAIITNDYTINITELQSRLESIYFGGFVNVGISYKGGSRLSVTVHNCIHVYKENSKFFYKENSKFSLNGLDDNYNNADDEDNISLLNVFQIFSKKQILNHIKEIIIFCLLIFTISIYFSWDTAKELQLTWQHNKKLLMEEEANPSIFFILQAVLANWLRILRIL